ncbi:hypothetical protein NKJ04_17500 [Mesorhizobium sp. M0618]|uniref:DUF7940 domain-containing protein n=1 Tax=Mesorhizobium sp. M0618 TaxID=2956972 RepID=UPI003337B8E3
MVERWQRILLHAWSARLIYLAFAFQVLEQLLPFFDENSFGISPEAFRLITMFILVGAVWARVRPQPYLHLEKTHGNEKHKGEQARKIRHRRSLAQRCRDFLDRIFGTGKGHNRHRS